MKHRLFGKLTVRILTLAFLAVAAGILADKLLLSPPVSRATTLPPPPAGWPSSNLELGIFSAPGEAAQAKAMANFAFRYQYLAGGVNTGNGWANWNPNGAFVTYYVQDSIDNNITPVFSYYMLCQSAPNNCTDEYNGDYTNLNNVSTMTAFYNDLKLFYQRAGAFPTHKVILQFEPDLWGYLQKHSTSDNATTVSAAVASTGLSELAGLPNTAAGFAKAAIHLRDLYAPNVLVAYHLSMWGTGVDPQYSKPDDSTTISLATRSAAFFNSLGANFDLSFADNIDRDAAFYQYQYGNTGQYWATSDYNRNVLYLSTYSQAINKRVVLWQLPFGNTKMRAENNTWDHYQDNHVETLLGDSNRTMLQAYVNAGVIAFLFGRGSDGNTNAADSAGDGVTNPAAINGNTGVSLSADDDGGYFKQQADLYYSTGTIGLPNASQSPDTTPPSVPTGLHTTAIASGSVSLAWTASTDTGGSELAGYKLYRNGSLIATIVGGSTLSYMDNGLSGGTTYAYTVSAYDNAGNEGAKSGVVNATTSSSSVVGDCNGDGHVNVTDLSILLSHYGAAYASSDFNNDGLVNIVDLSMLLSHYGT